ncbi:DUF7310 family coiled-coil domain-containing protein [Halosimplex salinum]|uniref:DUF7310 family coiled-coil domain-containing protein n=1 Tax=Halosimplex salinum TaxID=1710538 RepID=UPI000F465512|nr:hypothetical protein [Halosimplex salinum]
MTDIERLDERLTAVERAVVDGDYELDELADLAAVADDLDRLESRLDDVEERLATVEARSQSVEGFVGQVRSVNEDVEKRADAAIAAVDRLERRVGELEALTEGPARGGRGDDRHRSAGGGHGRAGPENPERSVDRVVTGGDQGRGRDAGGANGQGRGAGAGAGNGAGTGAGGRGGAGRRAGTGGAGGRAGTANGSGRADTDGDADQEMLSDTFDRDDDDGDGILTAIRSKLP